MKYEFVCEEDSLEEYCSNLEGQVAELKNKIEVLRQVINELSFENLELREQLGKEL